MQTIQHAISEAMRLIAAIEAGTLSKEEITKQVSELFSNEVSARGFMAALGTSNVVLSGEANEGLLDGLRQHQEVAYDLLVKNIIMSASASVNHLENGQAEQAAESDHVTNRCVEIAKQLNDPALIAKVEEVLAAIHHYEVDPKTKHDAHAVWFNFFERWGYEGRHLKAAKPHVDGLLEQLKMQ
ncbi:hypothetical protein BH11CYA1_BH11CYA1_06070 [soil metagenome]